MGRGVSNSNQPDTFQQEESRRSSCTVSQSDATNQKLQPRYVAHEPKTQGDSNVTSRQQNIQQGYGWPKPQKQAGSRNSNRNDLTSTKKYDNRR